MAQLEIPLVGPPAVFFCRWSLGLAARSHWSSYHFEGSTVHLLCEPWNSQSLSAFFVRTTISRENFINLLLFLLFFFRWLKKKNKSVYYTYIQFIIINRSPCVSFIPFNVSFIPFNLRRNFFKLVLNLMSSPRHELPSFMCFLVRSLGASILGSLNYSLWIFKRYLNYQDCMES